MDTLTLVVIAAIVLVVVIVLILLVSRQRRSRQLKSTFGPEYDRTVKEVGGRGRAERELDSRQKRRQQLDIRPLDPSARDHYAQEWRQVQADFVDAPSNAVRSADELVMVVMRERGYPTDDFEQRAADVSVDHPGVVEDYRAAHRVSVSNGENRASTEDLRLAMKHYRSLFEDLLGGDVSSNEESIAGRNGQRENSVEQPSTRGQKKGDV